jgi:hypothetical protein
MGTWAFFVEDEIQGSRQHGLQLKDPVAAQDKVIHGVDHG